MNWDTPRLAARPLVYFELPVMEIMLSIESSTKGNCADNILQDCNRYTCHT